MTDIRQLLLQLGEVDSDPDAAWLDYRRLGVGENDVDTLLNMLGGQRADPADDEADAAWAPLHAWRALGQIGSAKAIEPLITLFDQLLDDDWALTEVPRVMGMIGAAAIPALTRHLTESSHDEFARVMAMDGLYEIAACEPGLRDEIVERLRAHLRQPDENARVLNALTVGRLIDLKATEAIDEIRALFARHCIEITCNGDLELVELELGLRDRRDTPQPNFLELEERERLAYLRDNNIDEAEEDVDVHDADDIYAVIDLFLTRYGNDKSVLDVSELDGFFAALACAPDMILPSRWLPAIWGGEEYAPVWRSKNEINLFSNAVFALYDTVMHTMNLGDYEPLFLQREVEGKQYVIVDEWCHGFLRGTGLWGALTDADTAVLEENLQKIRRFATDTGHSKRDDMSAEEITTCQQGIEADVRRLFMHFRDPQRMTVVRRTEKVGRNDPCPCGSGKKFKKCCLH